MACERRLISAGALLALALTGCGASMTELREHHVWERALCEATPEEAPAVRAGIEADEQLAVAIQAVPPASIIGVRQPEGAPPRTTNPFDDLVLARVHRSANDIPVDESSMRIRLLVDGQAGAREELDFEEVVRRTGESLPRDRVVHHPGGGGGGGSSIGPLEFLGRLFVGVITLGMSELLIRSASSRAGSGYTTTERPSPSEIAAAAPFASALSVAYEELARGGDVYVWRRPAAGERAIEITLTHRARCQRARERATLTERLVIPLAREGGLEDAIAARFGDREHTLAELRVMARGPTQNEP